MAAGFTGEVVGTALNGGGFWDCMGAGITGAAKGGIFGGLGAYAAALAPAGALWGGLYGAGTGGLLGGAQSALNGGSFWDGVTMGAAFGLIGGAAQGYSSAKAQGLNRWTGAKLPETTTNTPVAPAAVQNAANKPAGTGTATAETPTTSSNSTYDFTPDPYGDNVKLYRGTTGTESNSKFPLYMTDDANYAGGYVSNGGRVVEVTIPRSTIRLMDWNGMLEISPKPQLHINGSSGIEYKFNPQVKPFVIYHFK